MLSLDFFPFKRRLNLRQKLMSLLGGSQLLTLLFVLSSVAFFMVRAERDGWKGRQAEAARSAAGTVAALVTRSRDALALAGSLDAGLPDAGLPDAGLPDAGLPDAGLPDAGLPDAGLPDAGLPDAGLPDGYQQVLEGLITQNPALLELVCLDARGQPYASVAQDRPLLASLYTIPISQWFATARQGQPYLSSLQTSATGQSYLILSQPSAGQGVIAARLKMDILDQMVAAIHFGEAGQAFIVDAQGRVVAHTNPALRQASTGQIPALTALLHNLERQNWGEYFNLEGRPVVAAAAPVPGTDWTVVTELPQAEAYHRSRAALLWMGLTIFSLTSLLMMAIARGMDRVLVRPMNKVKETVTAFGRGDFSSRLNFHRQDEVGVVARAFDDMADRLEAQQAQVQQELSQRLQVMAEMQQLNAELEQRVLERTAEIEQSNLALTEEVAERRRTEEALSHSERYFRRLIENASDLITILEPDGTIRYESPSAYHLLGYAPDTVLGENIFDFVHPEDVPLILSAFQRATGKMGAVEAVEVRLRHQDGSWRYLESLGQNLMEDPVVSGILINSRDITERKKAEAEAQRRSHQMETLRQMSLKLTAELNSEALLVSIVAQAVDFLESEMGGLYLLDPAQDVIRLSVGTGTVGKLVGTALRRGEGLCGKVWESGQAMQVEHYAGWEGRSLQFDLHPVGAVIAAPVTWGEQFLGVLNVSGGEGQRYTQEDLELLSLFAAQAAIAIRNANFLETQEKQRRRAEAIAQVNAVLSSTLELEPLLRDLLAAVVQAVPAAESGLILLKDEADGSVVPRAVYGYVEPGIEQLKFSPAGWAAHPVAQIDRPLLIPDVHQPPWAGSRAAPPFPERVRSALVAPLRHRRSTFGMLSLENGSCQAYFTGEDLDLLSVFAHQAAIAIENANLHARVQRLAVTDPLTGLYNRRHFFDFALREFERAQATRRSLAVIMFDIDRFKSVNDTFGHAVGDVILQEVAERCRSRLRSLDVFGRYGGEEFVVLLPETTGLQAEKVAERMRLVLDREAFTLGDCTVKVTASFGVAALEPACPSLDTLLNQADLALYQAKQAGRNRVTLWGG